MLDKKIEKAINDQINFELFSAYLYLAMAAYFSSLNLNGFANWMKVQVMEEQSHAKKFYDYVLERGGKITLTGINGPQNKWKSPLAAFEDALAHERIVTEKINNLMNLAIELKDHASTSFFQWFIDEQVEEESTADGIIQSLKLIGKDSGGLFMIDKELASRIFNPPAGVTI